MAVDALLLRCTDLYPNTYLPRPYRDQTAYDHDVKEEGCLVMYSNTTWDILPAGVGYLGWWLLAHIFPYLCPYVRSVSSQSA